MTIAQHCAGLGDRTYGVKRCAKSATCARYLQWWTAPKGLPVDMYLCAGTNYAKFMPMAAAPANPAELPVGTTADLFGATA